MTNRICLLFPIFILLVSFHADVFAQDEPPLLAPLNSDPLTERGISPRVLDVALFPLSQGLAFETTFTYRMSGPDSKQEGRFRVVFDPDTEYGRDMYIEFEDEPMQSRRKYRRMLESSLGKDYWIRKEDRLYDPKSLKVTDQGDGYEIVYFRFDKHRVPSSQRWLTRLQGQVHIRKGDLQRIDFVAEDTIERDGVYQDGYRSSIIFGPVPDVGGYVIDQIEEQYERKLDGQRKKVRSHGRFTRYSYPGIGEIAWTSRPTELIEEDVAPVLADEEDILRPVAVPSLVKRKPNPDSMVDIDRPFEARSDVKLDLHRTLPVWADDVRKMGFELPKTYGISVIGLIQDAEMQINDIGVGGISVVDDVPLLQRLGNKADSAITTVQLRGDVWLLPFLNFSVIAGTVETDTDVTLHFTPLFQSLYLLKTGEELPATAKSNASTTANTLGAGLTTGFAYENLIVSASLNYATTTTNETETEIDALIIVGMAGYDFGDIGLQVLAGAQYLETDRVMHGRIDLGPGQDPLEFSLGIEMEEVLFMAGFNKFIGRDWQMTGFLGANGTRKQATLMFGYRW